MANKENNKHSSTFYLSEMCSSHETVEDNHDTNNNLLGVQSSAIG